MHCLLYNPLLSLAQGFLFPSQAPLHSATREPQENQSNSVGHKTKVVLTRLSIFLNFLLTALPLVRTLCPLDWLVKQTGYWAALLKKPAFRIKARPLVGPSFTQTQRSLLYRSGHIISAIPPKVFHAFLSCLGLGFAGSCTTQSTPLRLRQASAVSALLWDWDSATIAADTWKPV